MGVLGVIEENGYTIDYIGGTWIGGFVSTHIAMGNNAAEIKERFRNAFDEEWWRCSPGRSAGARRAARRSRAC